MMCWQKRPSFKALGPINWASVSIIWVIFVPNFLDVSVCTVFLSRIFWTFRFARRYFCRGFLGTFRFARRYFCLGFFRRFSLHVIFFGRQFVRRYFGRGRLGSHIIFIADVSVCTELFPRGYLLLVPPGESFPHGHTWLPMGTFPARILCSPRASSPRGELSARAHLASSRMGTIGIVF